MTDSELVAAILRGDERAFKVLVHRHGRMLLRAARAILRDDAEAEDAVQDALVHAYGALRDFRGESKLSTWLVRIAVNEALMRRRRRSREALAVPLDFDAGLAEPDGLAAAPGPEGEAVHDEIIETVEERLATLPEEYRSVFRLRGLEELSVRETAVALGIPEATVRSRYFRARGLLAHAMSQALGKRSLPPISITSEDLERLRRLKPHAALLRELERASVVSRKAALRTEAITMHSQAVYTDETTGRRRLVNILYPDELGGCSCAVSVLTPVGSALIGLSPGQSIDWHFADGMDHRLRVDRVIQGDCPRNAAPR